MICAVYQRRGSDRRPATERSPRRSPLWAPAYSRELHMSRCPASPRCRGSSRAAASSRSSLSMRSPRSLFLRHEASRASVPFAYDIHSSRLASRCRNEHRDGLVSQHCARDAFGVAVDLERQRHGPGETSERSRTTGSLTIDPAEPHRRPRARDDTRYSIDFVELWTSGRNPPRARRRDHPVRDMPCATLWRFAPQPCAVWR